MVKIKKENITIIIPVINEEKIIGHIINYLLKYPSIEVIFVDGGSQDNTVEIIKKSLHLHLENHLVKFG